ncbi:BTB/POZ protein [Rhizophagus irregularis DAOM 181602=DAOM 197198]|nr:BTB/POZ protein [Rhizophagus irregularis DAOM 181602=DAOM 197198]
MPTQFFSKLSQNFIELLKDDEYYDITIEVAHIKLPKISPEIFQTILEYIYGGILSLNTHDISDSLKVLVAADNLHLQELIEFSQKVRSYQKLLDQQLYEELLNSYLEPDANNALDYSRGCGPQFGHDLNINSYGKLRSDESTPFDSTYCQRINYEKRIRGTKCNFSIEDYEVFQIMRK